MKTEIAIIGDHFMRADILEARILAVCGDRVWCRGIDFGWPEEPIIQGFDGTGLDGIREYQGDPEQVVKHVGSASILVTHLAPLPGHVLEQMPSLKLLIVVRGGPVNVDFDAVRRLGLAVAHTPGRNSSAVAEFTIGVMIAQTRNVTRGHDALRGGHYRHDLYHSDIVGQELSDMTVGIVGYGAVGRLVARHLRAFGSELLVCDPYAQLSREDMDAGLSMAGLEDLLQRSDIVTLHARVTPTTVGMMNADAFRLMKPGSVFINTARGPLVDYDALYGALTDGPLRGAAIETFASEPPAEDLPLLRLPNVTLTPHIAGASSRTIHRASDLAATEVHRWINGRALLNPCH